MLATNNGVFRLPGEWEKQSAILITWPHRHSDWVDNLAEIERLYIKLSHAICRYQKLIIITYDLALQKHIKTVLSAHNLGQINHDLDNNSLDTNNLDTNSLDNITFHIFKTDDTWTRDYGPIYLTETTSALPKTRLLDFTFNGWGHKYSAALDNQLSTDLLHNKIINADEIEKIDFVLEGGSIESDGNGTVLTTSRCLLSKERNPGFTQHDIALFLQTTLNAKQVLWLDEGYLAGDDTDSHIDVLARFSDLNTIVYVKCDDEKDEHYTSSIAMEAQLKRFRNKTDQAYKLIPLPFPSAKYDANNQRLPASYANFLIINGAVLVPTYSDANDEIALKILSQCFKDRDVIGIPFLAAIQQNGSLHCLTMQLPAFSNTT